MKMSSLMCAVLACTALFMVVSSTKLEARHHTSFALNFAPSYPAYRPGYIVERPQTYVQERVYVSSCGHTTYVERTPVTYVEPVYVAPRPVARPFGFSFGFLFR